MNCSDRWTTREGWSFRMERIPHCDMNLAVMGVDIGVDIIILVLVQTVMRIDMFVCQSADVCKFLCGSSAEMPTLRVFVIKRLPRMWQVGAASGR